MTPGQLWSDFNNYSFTVAFVDKLPLRKHDNNRNKNNKSKNNLRNDLGSSGVFRNLKMGGGGTFQVYIFKSVQILA